MGHCKRTPTCRPSRKRTPAAEDAVGTFATLSDAALRHDYGFTARLIAFAASKVLAAQQVRETLGAGASRRTRCARAGPGPARRGHRRARVGAGRVPALRAEFETRW